jgi:signal peptidase I
MGSATATGPLGRTPLRRRVTKHDRLRRVLYGPSPRRALLRAALLAAGLLLLSRVAFMPLRAFGESMEPTYHQGQWLLVNRLAYRYRGPERGEVVAIRLAGGRAALVKRIVGLPGERLRVDAGTVLVDDRPLNEPYVRLRQPWQVDEVHLADDEYFVIGDNRGMPADAHDFGRTSRDRLLGPLMY